MALEECLGIKTMQLEPQPNEMCLDCCREIWIGYMR